MLLKYNDGETTYILYTRERFNVDDIDYLNDVAPEDISAAIYMKDGETIHTMNVLIDEPSIEEPHIEEL